MPEVQYEDMVACIVRLIIFCGSPCSGLIVTSYRKDNPSRKLKKEFYSSINHYKKFKKMFELDPTYKGDYSKLKYFN